MPTAVFATVFMGDRSVRSTSGPSPRRGGLIWRFASTSKNQLAAGPARWGRPCSRSYPFSVRTAALQAAAGNVRPKAFAERTETLRPELKSRGRSELRETAMGSLLERESGRCCGLKAAVRTLSRYRVQRAEHLSFSSTREGAAMRIERGHERIPPAGSGGAGPAGQPYLLS